MAYAKKKAAVDESGLPTVPIELRVLNLRLVGDTPLITNAWSEKARNMMRAKQQKTVLTAREAKVPEADFKASLYAHPDGNYGFKAIAFKSAAVTALSQVDGGLTKVRARGCFHVGDSGSSAELVRIECPNEPRMREDPVRVATGTADLRYRGEFWPWAATLRIRYNARSVAVPQLVSLFNLAGFAVGVGEWRPEKDGINGMFHVEPNAGEADKTVLAAIAASNRQIGHDVSEQPQAA